MTFPIAGSRVFITGGAGFVGSHIADALLEAGAARVIALDNFVRGTERNVEKALRHPAFELVRGDVRDRALVSKLTEGCDYVFHQAALRITACAEDPRAGHEVMLDGAFNVLEAAAQHKVKKVVAASSASVYGEPDELPMKETAAYNNRTLYGAAKIALEHYLRSFNEMYGLPFVALRYFNLYGPRMDTTGVYTEVMIRWLDRIDKGLPPIVFGKGDQSMDFVYIGDCVRANLLALESDASDVFLNVATGKDTSLLDLAKMMLDLASSKLTVEHAEERKVSPVRRRQGSVDLARERIGFTAQTELREGLAALIAWRKDLQ